MADAARLLVADDNKVNRLLLARSLEQQGHRVALALDGRMALEMLRSQDFGVFLSDIAQAHDALSADTARHPFPIRTASSTS